MASTQSGKASAKASAVMENYDMAKEIARLAANLSVLAEDSLELAELHEELAKLTGKMKKLHHNLAATADRVAQRQTAFGDMLKLVASAAGEEE